MEGWIKLHRRIEKHWIWSDSKYLMGWVYCLIRANHEPNKVLIGTNLITVNRGEFITSRDNFAKATTMSPQMVRTFWALLEKDEMINRESTSTSAKIRICKYDTYQDVQPASNQRSTSGQPAVNQRSTTDKNVKKEKNNKNIVIRNLKFDTEVKGYSEKYPPDMLAEFIRYWTEPNKSNTKMRFELQPTWAMSGRLATWYGRYQEKMKDSPKGTNLAIGAKLPDDYGTIRPGTITREEFRKNKDK